MELDSFNREISMSNAHYLIVICRLGGDFEVFRQALSFGDKRMVSRSLEWAVYSAQDSFAVVSDRAGLAVPESSRSNDSSAERVNNPLVSKTNT